ncbi:MAG: type II secretion system protein [Solidesulfovibrio sp.]
MGFTLIEVIITLVLFGIMATMLGPYLVRSVSQSSTPLTNLKKEMSLQTSMEQIIASYESGAKNIAALAALKTSIDANTTDYTPTTKFVALGASGNDFTGAVTANTMLLVTLKSKTTGESLTTLFTATN